MKLPLVLVVAMTISSGESYYNCHKPSMGCQNGGTCTEGAKTCTCTDDYEGDDCAVEKARINGNGCADTTCDNGYCMAGGTCKCPPVYYGNKCNLMRFRAVCTDTSMLILINPYPTFTGLMYIEDHPKDPCLLIQVANNPNSDIPAGSQGRYLKLANADQRCGAPMTTVGDGNEGVKITRRVTVSYQASDRTFAMDHFEFSCLYLPIIRVVESNYINVEDIITTTITTNTDSQTGNSSAAIGLGLALILSSQLLHLLLC